MSGQAMSNSLNYADLKRKAVSARSFRVNQTSRSGTKFDSGSNFQIQLPSAARQYADLGNCVLQFSIYMNGAATGSFDCNAYSIFDRCTTSAAGGAIIEDITGLGKWYQSSLAESVSENNIRNVSKVCHGSRGLTNYKFLGESIGNGVGNKMTINLPLFHGIFSAEKMIPLDTNSPLEFNFYLNSADDALVIDAAGTLATFSIENPTLIIPVVEISPDAQAMLDQSVGALGYNINFTGIAHSTDVKPANVTSIVSQLPFKYSSLEKITCLHFSDQIKNQGDFTQSNRSTAEMRQFSIKVGGLRYPQIPITMKADSFGEALNETLLSNNLLGDMFHHTNLVIEDPAGDADERYNTNYNNYQLALGQITANTVADISATGLGEYGQFMLSLSLETFKNPISEGGLYSGLSTIGSTVQACIDYDTHAHAMDIHYYATYSAVLSLEPSSRTWQISS